jgi:UDP-N-acetylmuramoyl-tripeptide--D-alanyl-D-alanine ligase
MELKQEIIQKTLKFFARKILQKYEPRVIGITGSVGKSTAKEMIFTVLDGAGLNVRKSKKNYNNEIGIPLTIIGVSGEKKNVLQWVNVLLKAINLVLFSSKYPEILVLELAVDHPGDMKYFCNFIPVEVGVLTNVGISHLENFGSKKAILKEKSYLLKQAKKMAIYNKDSLRSELNNINLANIVTYGFEKGNFQIDEVGYNYEQGNILAGMIFKVFHKREVLSGKLNSLIGRPYLYGVLSALSVAEYFDIEIANSLKYLENARVIPGHMAVLKGIKQTSLIDDTYNSAPASLTEALNVLEEIEAKRKIVVLGDMLELGGEEDSSHKVVGKRLANMENIIFVAVGKRMKIAVSEFEKVCRKLGIRTFENNSKNVYWFKNSTEAGRAVQDLMQQDDLILIKGSQGMRMEKVVVEIMAEPNNKKELVVRQNKDWV